MLLALTFLPALLPFFEFAALERLTINITLNVLFKKLYYMTVDNYTVILCTCTVVSFSALVDLKMWSCMQLFSSQYEFTAVGNFESFRQLQF